MLKEKCLRLLLLVLVCILFQKKNTEPFGYSFEYFFYILLKTNEDLSKNNLRHSSLDGNVSVSIKGFKVYNVHV